MNARPTPVYHITAAENLPAIVAAGGLRAHNALHRASVSYQSIAHPNIQARRATTRVPHPPGGVLHDYVPLYFAPRSPMLFVISRGGVASYPEGQERVLHLATSAQHVQAAGLPFVFTDGHAIMAFSQFFTDLAQLDQIDWAVMRGKYWHDTPADPDRCRRREAEFLVYHSLPWDLITEIGVCSRPMQEEIAAMLQKAAHRPVVQIHREWYY